VNFPLARVKDDCWSWPRGKCSLVIFYQTGQSPPADAQGVAFFWHVNNLAKSAHNLGRAATSIALMLRGALPAQQGNGEYWNRKKSPIGEVLHSYWDLLDDGLKQFLIRQRLGPL
jgi:hypothetical protein